MPITEEQKRSILSSFRARSTQQQESEQDVALRTGVGVERFTAPPVTTPELPEAGGGLLSDLLLDIAGTPQRLATIPGRIFKDVRQGQILHEAAQGLARAKRITPDEALPIVLQEALSGKRPELMELGFTQEEAGAIIDAATLAFPAGKIGGALSRIPGAKKLAIEAGGVAGGVRLVPKDTLALKIGRGALAGAKGTALIPEKAEAGSVEERLETALVGGAVGAALPPVGRVLSPVGRFIGQEIESLAQRGLTAKGTQKVQARLLESRLVEALKARSPDKILNEDIPALSKEMEIIGREVSDVLAPAGRLLEREAGTIAETGTVSAAAKPARAAIAKGLGEAESFLVSADKIHSIQQRGVAVTAGLRAIAKVVGAQTESEEARASANVLLKRAIQVENQLGELQAKAARSAGLSLRQFQVPLFANRAEVEAAFGELDSAVSSFIKQKDLIGRIGLSPLQREIERVRAGGNLAGALLRGGVDYWRLNIFPLFSAGLDFLSNTAATASQFKQNVAADLFDFINEGASFSRTSGILRSVFSEAAFKGNQRIESRLTGTALGEKIPTGFFGRDLFSFIFPERDSSRMVKFADRVTNVVDELLFLPAATKRGIDTAFKRIGAVAHINDVALREAEKLGLKGTAKKAFVRGFIEQAPDDVLDKAVQQGNRFGFNRSLSRIEEELAGSGNLGTVVKLFVSPFPRWQFQLYRFVAEHTPLDPGYWGKLKRGEATAVDFVQFLDRNTTGVLGLAAVDSLLYDKLDKRTLEYVREDGSRVPLGFIEPIPQAVAILAALKGDMETSFNAIRRAGTFGLRAEGIATGIINELPGLFSGNESKRRESIERFNRSLRGFIPGRGVLRALRQISDPTEREGVFGDVPVVSKRLPAKISPTTGEDLSRRAELLFLKIDMPDMGIPLSARKVNRVEKKINELNNLDLKTRIGLRPPQVGDIDGVDPGEVPADVRRIFERTAGHLFNQEVSSLLDLPEFEKLPADEQARAIMKAKRDAIAFARAQVDYAFPVSNLP